MKKAFFIILLIISNATAQQRIQISYDNSRKEKVELDKFYFTHQIFSEAFYMTRLNKELSVDEMHLIIQLLLDNLSIANNNYVKIDDLKGNSAKFIFRIIEQNSKKVLVMKTNYNAKNERFENDITDATWMRFYIISDTALIHNSDLYNEQSEREAKQKNSYSLINFYMFDDVKDNNVHIKPLIDKILKDGNSSKIDILYAKLYEGEYHLMNYDIASADKTVKDLRNYFEANKNKGIPEDYKLIPDMAETELTLIKKLLNK